MNVRECTNLLLTRRELLTRAVGTDCIPATGCTKPWSRTATTCLAIETVMSRSKWSVDLSICTASELNRCARTSLNLSSEMFVMVVLLVMVVYVVMVMLVMVVLLMMVVYVVMVVYVMVVGLVRISSC